MEAVFANIWSHFSNIRWRGTRGFAVVRCGCFVDAVNKISSCDVAIENDPVVKCAKAKVKQNGKKWLLLEH